MPPEVAKARTALVAAAKGFASNRISGVGGSDGIEMSKGMQNTYAR